MTDATPVSDPSVNQPRATSEKEKESLRLEEDLDAAVRNASIEDTAAPNREDRLDSGEKILIRTYTL